MICQKRQIATKRAMFDPELLLDRPASTVEPVVSIKVVRPPTVGIMSGIDNPNMTEAEWLVCTDPQDVLITLLDCDRATERKYTTLCVLSCLACSSPRGMSCRLSRLRLLPRFEDA